jgi:Uma2 family endonuclease
LDTENLPLPTSAELPDSDDTPVDNEYQNTLPNWLLAVLEEIWSERQDWYFGVDMGIYDREGQQKRAPTLVPDGFLSLGVTRHKRENKGRLSYVLQEEKNIPPIFALEYVSLTYNGEYQEKMQKYASLGVKYYLIYNPEYYKRDKHEVWEMYKLVQGSYEKQRGEPFWLNELGLGIGRVKGELGGIVREWLAWFDETGNPYPLPSQLIRQERQRAAQLAQALEQTEQALEQTEQALEQTEQALEQTEQALEQERLEKLRLLEKLRELELDM